MGVQTLPVPYLHASPLAVTWSRMLATFHMPRLVPSGVRSWIEITLLLSPLRCNGYNKLTGKFNKGTSETSSMTNTVENFAFIGEFCAGPGTKVPSLLHPSY